MNKGNKTDNKTNVNSGESDGNIVSALAAHVDDYDRSGRLDWSKYWLLLLSVGMV